MKLLEFDNYSSLNHATEVPHMDVKRSKKIKALVCAIGLTCLSFQAGAQQSWSYTYHSNGQIETADGPRTDVND
ncbi:hypothetical protein, partial [Aurantivibrio infirmus]